MNRQRSDTTERSIHGINRLLPVRTAAGPQDPEFDQWLEVEQSTVLVFHLAYYRQPSQVAVFADGVKAASFRQSPRLWLIDGFMAQTGDVEYGTRAAFAEGRGRHRRVGSA